MPSQPPILNYDITQTDPSIFFARHTTSSRVRSLYLLFGYASALLLFGGMLYLDFLGTQFIQDGERESQMGATFVPFLLAAIIIICAIYTARGSSACALTAAVICGLYVVLIGTNILTTRGANPVPTVGGAFVIVCAVPTMISCIATARRSEY